MMQENIYREMQYLVMEMLDNKVSEEGFARLEEILRDDPAAQLHYLEIIKVNLALTNIRKTDVSFPESTTNELIWQAWADVDSANYRKEDVVFKGDGSECQACRLKKTMTPEAKAFWIRFVHITTATLSTAAVILLIVLISISGPKNNVYQVATVDSVVGQAGKLAAGEPLMNNAGKMHVGNNAVAKLTTIYGAEIIIEGPAEFILADSEDFYLDSGKVYCYVPSNALGLTVHTPLSKVIDLGTEFGLDLNKATTQELHVFNGKTSLISGPRGRTVKSLIVEAGEAREIESNGNIEVIAIKQNQFVKEICKGSNFKWRGDNLSLADLFGGGNGFGTGKKDMALTIKNWKLQRNGQYGHVQYWDGFAFWKVIDNVKYVDSVFSTRSESNSRLSTTGLTYNFPTTRGDMFIGFANGIVNRKKPILDGVDYSQADEEILTFCANLGVTFDLNEVRKDLSGLNITEFKTRCGINDSDPRGDADIWVLVDGVVVQEIKNVKYNDPSFEISIPITGDQRFLSIALTDGGSEHSNGGDWAIFVSPELVLEPLR